MFGLHGEQIEQAGRIAKALGEEWRGLVAGKEGYLLNKGQEGTVRWGEMPLAFPNHFTIYHRLTEPVSESASPTKLLLSSLLLSTAVQRPSARIQEEIVIFDYRAQKSARLPEHMQTMLRVRWEEQEQTKTMWENRAKQLEEMVGRLEKESWDRQGAVEDVGKSS
ncbi:hypothetical protein MMC18_004043 [Xylographa bjoerkii]|nr:hypothetical protein [Xylographa bjoerkii]